MKTLCVLLSLSLAAPPEKGRKLTAEEEREVARLTQDCNRQLNVGEHFVHVGL